MTKTVEELVQEVITLIEGQNWSDVALGDDEKNLIRMSVQATLDLAKVPQEET